MAVILLKLRFIWLVLNTRTLETPISNLNVSFFISFQFPIIKKCSRIEKGLLNMFPAKVQDRETKNHNN